MTVLTETPHELVAVHLLVTIVIHATEDNSETTDTVGATRLHCVQNLLKNLIGRFALDSKHWVDVGVVATATNSEPSGKLLVVELIVAILVILGEYGSLFVFGEGAADALKSSGEL